MLVPYSTQLAVDETYLRSLLAGTGLPLGEGSGRGLLSFGRLSLRKKKSISESCSPSMRQLLLKL